MRRTSRSWFRNGKKLRRTAQSIAYRMLLIVNPDARHSQTGVPPLSTQILVVSSGQTARFDRSSRCMLFSRASTAVQSPDARACSSSSTRDGREAHPARATISSTANILMFVQTRAPQVCSTAGEKTVQVLMGSPQATGTLANRVRLDKFVNEDYPSCLSGVPPFYS